MKQIQQSPLIRLDVIDGRPLVTLTERVQHVEVDNGCVTVIGPGQNRVISEPTAE